MGRARRNTVRGENEIKAVINENLPYVLVNNEIFDQLYEMEQLVIDAERYKGKKVKLTEADMIIYIFLQFLHTNKMALDKTEIANYLKMTDRQVRESIYKLSHIKAFTNSKFNPHSGNIEIIEESEIKLIKVKNHVAFNPATGKKQKKDHYYPNFYPKAKTKTIDDKEKVFYHNFFCVHIDEFELLRNGTLSRVEFILYLFLIRIHNVSRKEPIAIKMSKISERLNIKMVENVYKYINQLLTVKLDGKCILEEIKPKNYEERIINGLEPSCRYTPIYNLTKIAEVNASNNESAEINSDKSEVNLSKVEANSFNSEVDFNKTEVNSFNSEMNYGNSEVNDAIWEIDL